MLTQEYRETLETLAVEYRVEPAALMAVVEVESGGRIFAKIDGRNEPLIRFEGHYFYRLTEGEARAAAVRAGLADRRAGRIANPRSQAGRWKLLERAMEIDRTAALQSVSWGIGQVMGIHWQWLGYESVEAMVERGRAGIGGQAELMLRFIEKAGLKDAMNRRDWRAFARGYNGPGFRRNRYDEKLAAAYVRYANDLGGVPSEDVPSMPEPGVEPDVETTLSMGASGTSVRDVQRALRRHGFSLKVDGDFGPLTARAVRNFQRANDLVVDGVVGIQTFAALERPAHACA